MTLPAAEAALRDFLGEEFTETSKWRKILGDLMACEDGDDALKVLADGKAQFHSPGDASADLPLLNPPAQLTSAETDLMEIVRDLHGRKRISTAGMPTIEDLVNPPEECEIEQSQFNFQTDAEIVAAIRQEKPLRGASNDEDLAPDMATTDVLELCQKLEKICLAKGQPNQSMALAQELRQFRAHVRRDELLNNKQITLAEAWGMKTNRFRCI
ncbi:hypothetical protein B0H14DRAFT_2591584 [Mycena olivaceomarginata]|nr:hypothetical protein B0H14DRAFT_2591584 [Mycena olivaceomarginata]